MMIDEFLFVFSNSSVEFVGEAIDSGVHIGFGRICINCTTVHIDRGFRLMPQFFDGQYTADVGYEVKVTLDFLNFRLNITSEGIGYLNMMA